MKHTVIRTTKYQEMYVGTTKRSKAQHRARNNVWLTYLQKGEAAEKRVDERERVEPRVLLLMIVRVCRHRKYFPRTQRESVCRPSRDGQVRLVQKDSARANGYFMWIWIG